jgi:7-carboxy-7-deazaguanine synthase
MKNETLNVSETFYSIQGEGQTAGTPAVFLRLGGCNLLCDGKWRCDTIEVWKKSVSVPFEKVFPKDYIEALARGAHLVITGGEPLLQQAAIVAYLWWFAGNFGWRPIVEVETNGTIAPNDDMKKMVTYWNISPKLSNSGEPYIKRINEVVLAQFFNLCGVRSLCYKFVINDQEDVIEMLNEYFPLINAKRVWLMPAGENQEQLAVTRPIVAEACKQLFLNYSERLHIGIWNKKTGV